MITNKATIETYTRENGTRISPEYNSCVVSILNRVLGINTVKASDKINTKENMKEIKKLLNNVLLKKTNMKIQFRINTDKVDIIVEILCMFKAVINIDLHVKKINCFAIGCKYAFFVCFAFAIIANSDDSNRLIMNSQNTVNTF